MRLALRSKAVRLERNGSAFILGANPDTQQSLTVEQARWFDLVRGVLGILFDIGFYATVAAFILGKALHSFGPPYGGKKWPVQLFELGAASMAAAMFGVAIWWFVVIRHYPYVKELDRLERLALSNNLSKSAGLLLGILFVLLALWMGRGIDKDLMHQEQLTRFLAWLTFPLLLASAGFFSLAVAIAKAVKGVPGHTSLAEAFQISKPSNGFWVAMGVGLLLVVLFLSFAPIVRG